jgi:hypothetical protein
MAVLTTRDEIFRAVQNSVIRRKRNDPSILSSSSVEMIEEFAKLAVEAKKIVELLSAERPKAMTDAVGCRVSLPSAAPSRS